PPLSPRSRSPCLFLSKLGDARRPLPRGGPARPSATQPHNTAPPATHPPSDAHRLHTVRPRTRTRTRTTIGTTRTTIGTTRIRTDALRTSPAWAAARLASFDGGKLQSPAANLLIWARAYVLAPSARRSPQATPLEGRLTRHDAMERPWTALARPRARPLFFGARLLQRRSAGRRRRLHRGKPERPRSLHGGL